MSNTGFTIFDKTFQKTNKILTGIEEEFDWDDRREQSYTALRTVLHTLRDRLPVNQATNFVAQLPMLTKGIYFDGWDPANVPIKMDQKEFINNVQENFPYSIDTSISKFIQVVLDKVLEETDPNIKESLKESLPPEINEFL